MPKDVINSIGEDISVLEALIKPDMKLVKKYILDSEGRLRLYHPVTQRCIFRLLLGQSSQLENELEEYDKLKKKEEKEDC